MEKVINVLHVDDEPSFLQLTKQYMNILGDNELEVHSLSEPLKVFNQLKEGKFDVVVTDYQMPGMDGLKLLQEIRDQKIDIPVIIFTGRGREEVAINALNLGANYYIEKSFDPKSQFSELRHVIRQVVKHKRMEKALTESEERYRIIFDGSPVSLWEEDFSDVKRYFDQLKAQGVEDLKQYLDSHPNEVENITQMVKILNVNYTTLEMYNAKNITEFFEGLSTFFDEEATDLFKEELVALFNGETVYQNEFPGYKLTGERIEVIVRLSVIAGYEETLERVIVSVIDITQQKEVEKSLRMSVKQLERTQKTLSESEEKFRTLAEKSPNMIFIYSFIKKGRVVYANSKSEEILGYEREEFYSLDFDFLSLIAPDYKESIISNFQKHSKGEEVDPIEYELLTKSGEKITGILTTKLIDFKGDRAILGIITDITGFKQAQEELKRSEERYRQLIELSPDAIILCDLDMKIIMVNQQAVKLHGAKGQKDLIGKNAFDFIVLEDHDRAMNNFTKTLEMGTIRNIEYSMIKEDGTIFPADLSTAVIFDEKGYPASLIGVIRDITERKIAEEKLIRQKEELSDFAHFIAHDLSNCLTSIEGYTQLLDLEYDETHIISKQVEYMKKLLTRSLALADAGLAVKKDEDVDLNILVEGIAETVIPKNVIFTHDELPIILCDQDRLAQVFTNVFENAILHGKPQKIMIKVKTSENSHEILLLNDGEKIPSEIQKRIFDYGFSTLKDSMGLGLSIVRKIVEAHGWGITVQSDDESTSFQITIPLEE
ncbi:MAG: PAS domain S-box protein [Candidatus Heimdallarchaeota archaeon]|nr:MAG: PAS domain S-box protein [Candidatus Heimdallarchaeota archaeon]